jgi:hypothetical protein
VLDTEDTAGHTVFVDEVDTVTQDNMDEPEVHDEREVVQQEGWMDLVYSFLASGVMTVSTHLGSSSECLITPVACSVFLSRRFLGASVWEIPRS